MNQAMSSIYTYALNRKCLYCGTPIADQTHAKTIFCYREVLPDGSIKSCKDDFNAAKNREKNLPFVMIANYHKDVHRRLEQIYKDKGDTVTAEQLGVYEIFIDMPVKFSIDTAQKSTFYFIEYCLTQINQSQFKITKHENKFR